MWTEHTAETRAAGTRAVDATRDGDSQPVDRRARARASRDQLGHTAPGSEAPGSEARVREAPGSEARVRQLLTVAWRARQERAGPDATAMATPSEAAMAELRELLHAPGPAGTEAAAAIARAALALLGTPEAPRELVARLVAELPWAAPAHLDDATFAALRTVFGHRTRAAGPLGYAQVLARDDLGSARLWSLMAVRSAAVHAHLVRNLAAFGTLADVRAAWAHVARLEHSAHELARALADAYHAEWASRGPAESRYAQRPIGDWVWTYAAGRALDPDAVDGVRPVWVDPAVLAPPGPSSGPDPLQGATRGPTRDPSGPGAGAPLSAAEFWHGVAMPTREILDMRRCLLAARALPLAWLDAAVRTVIQTLPAEPTTAERSTTAPPPLGAATAEGAGHVTVGPLAESVPYRTVIQAMVRHPGAGPGAWERAGVALARLTTAVTPAGAPGAAPPREAWSTEDRWQGRLEWLQWLADAPTSSDATRQAARAALLARADAPPVARTRALGALLLDDPAPEGQVLETLCWTLEHAADGLAPITDPRVAQRLLTLPSRAARLAGLGLIARPAGRAQEATGVPRVPDPEPEPPCRAFRLG